VGTRVRHEMFGEGRVAHIAGRGQMARARVRFDDGIERTLILEYAGLRVVSEGNAW